MILLIEALKSWWKRKKIEIYLTAIIIPSIILCILTVWNFSSQYNYLNSKLKIENSAALSSSELGGMEKLNLFSSSLIIFSLVLILILGSYLSSRALQQQMELTRAKSDIISIVSHELKTPVASIRLLAERLIKLKPEETEKQKEYLGLTLKQSYHLSHLIENVLDFSKLEEKKQEYQFEATDLKQLLTKCLSEYPAKLIKPDCQIQSNLSSDIPLLNLDINSISRALINLLDNAFKFSPESGVVNVTLFKDSKNVYVEVANQGPGIKDTEAGKIFQRFYHTGKGTGLGLTIARHIIEMHQGQVGFESNPGIGTKFKIVLPLDKLQVKNR